MRLLNALALITTTTAATLVGTALLIIYILASGCSAEVNLNEKNILKPCANSRLVRDWPANETTPNYATFRADCTFTLVIAATNTVIAGTFEDLTVGRTKGEVKLTIGGQEDVYFYHIKTNPDSLSIY
jgi:hypothetical protein